VGNVADTTILLQIRISDSHQARVSKLFNANYVLTASGVRSVCNSPVGAAPAVVTTQPGPPASQLTAAVQRNTSSASLLSFYRPTRTTSDEEEEERSVSSMSAGSLDSEGGDGCVGRSPGQQQVAVRGGGGNSNIQSQHMRIVSPCTPATPQRPPPPGQQTPVTFTPVAGHQVGRDLAPNPFTAGPASRLTAPRKTLVAPPPYSFKGHKAAYQRATPTPSTPPCSPDPLEMDFGDELLLSREDLEAEAANGGYYIGSHPI